MFINVKGMAKEEYFHNNIIEIALSRIEKSIHWDDPARSIPTPASVARDVRAGKKPALITELETKNDELYDKLSTLENHLNRIFNSGAVARAEEIAPIVYEILVISFIINTPFIINTSLRDPEDWPIERYVNHYLNPEYPFLAFAPRSYLEDHISLIDICQIHFENLFYFDHSTPRLTPGTPRIEYNDKWQDDRDARFELLLGDTHGRTAGIVRTQEFANFVEDRAAQMDQERRLRPAPAPFSSPAPRGRGRAVGPTPPTNPPTKRRPGLFHRPYFGAKQTKTKGWWVDLKKDKKSKMGVKFVRVKNFRKYRYGVHVDPEYFEKMTGASFWDLPLYRSNKITG